MEQKLLELSDLLISGLKGATDLSKTEFPLFMQELIAYELYSSIFIASLSLLGIIICIFLTKLTYEYYQDHDIPPPAVPITVALILVISLLMNITSIIKVTTAPKVFLMEKAVSVFKTCK